MSNDFEDADFDSRGSESVERKRKPRTKLDESAIEHVHIALETSRLKTFYKSMETANLLSSIGSYDEALKHYAAAHTSLKLRMNSESSLYSTVFYQNLLRYANCLEYLGNIKMAEDIYIEALPGGGLVTGDYASFLHKKKKDYKQAEKYYRLALEQYPEHSSVHLKYASFLRHINKDFHQAEKHYKLACDSNRENADALGTYASFLHGALKRYDEAEIYYRAAVRADPTHVNNYCNYGLFLSEEKGLYDQAERWYKHAMEFEPRHANTLYNYAVMLDSHVNRKDEAEELYTRVLEIDDRHPYALYNLAVLLEDKLKIYKQEYNKRYANLRNSMTNGANDDDDNEEEEEEEDNDNERSKKTFNEDPELCFLKERLKETRAIVLDLYERATDADPDDPTAKADCARYIYAEFGSKKSSMEEKELYIEKYQEKVNLLLSEAINLDPQLEIALYTTASIKYNYDRDIAKAESFVKKLLSVNPTHVSGMHLLATIYLESTGTVTSGKGQRRGSIKGGLAAKDKTKTVEEAFTLLQKCAECTKDPSKLLVEYINATNKYGTKRHKLAAIAYCQQKCFSEFTDFGNNNSGNSKLEFAMNTLESAVGKYQGSGEV